MYSQCSECALPSENDSPVPFLCQWCQEKQVLQQSIDRANALEKENNNLRAELEQAKTETTKINKELEQARSLYQDRCSVVAKLREELETLKNKPNHETTQ